MKKILFIFCLFVTISVFSQEEKRLALVIGNANYEKGPLENPVNDARLIASTLDSLNFEVILHTNLETRRDLLGAISEFGKKRPLYDFGFIYYAGHGVQVDSENFLLPTKEIFESEIDVQDYGVSMQRVLKLLESGEEDELNILVLDACRDNPFEQTWNKTRSLKGNGLAKIPPPTGSLIAFSTDAGQTAPDGDGINSLYTQVLSKNLLKGGLSIEQVFKNVRGEVLEKSNGIQRPAEATQLVGKPYIINKNELFGLEEELKILFYKNVKDDGAIFSYDNENVINKYLTDIFNLDNNNTLALIIKLLLSVYENNEEYEKISLKIEKLSINQSYLNLIIFSEIYRGRFLYNRDKLNLSQLEIKNYLNSLEIKLGEINNLEFNNILFLDEVDINQREKWVTEQYYWLANYYQYDLNEYDKAIDLNKKYIEATYEFIKSNKEILSKNLEILEKSNRNIVIGRTNIIEILEIQGFETDRMWKDLYKEFPNDINLLSNRTKNLINLEEYELSEILLNKMLALDQKDPEVHTLLYHVNMYNEDYLSALANLQSAIEKLQLNYNYYISRPSFSIKKNGEYFVDLQSKDDQDVRVNIWELYIARGKVYMKVKNYKLMCQEFIKALDSSTTLESKKKIETIILENCSQ